MSHGLRVATAVAVSLGTAAGQTAEERAGARAAADQGYDAYRSGQWSQAVDLFERAEALVHSPLQTLFLARSQVQLGKLIEARENYLRIAREQLGPNASSAQQQARIDAEQELTALEPRIPLITVRVLGGDGSARFEVLQDGYALPLPLIGVERPVNPGPHTWRAKAVGYRDASVTQSLTEGTHEVVNLELQPLTAAERSAATGAAGEVMPGGHRAVPERGSSSAPWMYAGLGVAGLGLGLGLGFLLERQVAIDQLDDECGSRRCESTPARAALNEDIKRAGLISAIGFGTAGAALVGTGILWMLSDDEDPADRASVQPWLSARQAGVTIRF